MFSKTLRALVGLGATALLVAACGGASTSSETSQASAGASSAPAAPASAAAIGKVGVILPDAASAPRWETKDRPFLESAFKAAGVEYDIQNANGDKAKFATIADQMLASGVSVLILTNLDSPSAAAVIKKAREAGVSVIDYDRLTLGGGADYYVSFDNVSVGTNMGEGLVKCMQAQGKMDGPVALVNGAPTDNNATLFHQGYKAALEAAGYTIAADQAVPDWDASKAVAIFEQMYTKAKGDFVGVVAADDGLAGSVEAVLDRNGQAGKILVTGDDATDEGLQRILLGKQCVSTYKALKREADSAAALAVSLITGDTAAADTLVTGQTADSETGKDVPSVLLPPVAIFAENVKDVIADGYTTVDNVCTTDELKAACKEYGVQ